MADPKAQVETQLRNIEASTGMTIADFTAAIQTSGLEKHGQMVKFLKTTHGLGHGNANLIAHTVRQALAGGPPSAESLLAAQYAGKKAGLVPIYEALAALAQGMGEDVEMVVQKTGVSFRRAKQFALVQAPSSKRIQLGLNLDETPDGGRVVAMKGMCTHKANLTEVAAVDAEVEGWIRAAYERAG